MMHRGIICESSQPLSYYNVQPLLHVGELCHLQESVSQYVQQSTTYTIIQHLHGVFCFTNDN